MWCSGVVSVNLQYSIGSESDREGDCGNVSNREGGCDKGSNSGVVVVVLCQ